MPTMPPHAAYGIQLNGTMAEGTHNEATDALSRHPHRPPSARDDLAEYKTDGILAPILAPSIT